MTTDWTWWRDGVIYNLYSRSFADANADGLGDLQGILHHLDDLQYLGVDALWLTPFYPTADGDYGYDVTDYYSVDPRMGTLEDFDRLLAEAHRLLQEGQVLLAGLVVELELHLPAQVGAAGLVHERVVVGVVE